METKYIVNNKQGQTINGEPILRPYRVFSALLTQSGTDNPIAIINVSLVIGVTYMIKSPGGGGDFTNVGAPNNDLGTQFIATGTTPTTWGTTYLEYNSGAPIAKVILENNIGNIWFDYGSSGTHSVKSLGLFTYGKTLVNFNSNAEGFYGGTVGVNDSNSDFLIETTFIATHTRLPTASIMSIEIKVYN